MITESYSRERVEVMQGKCSTWFNFSVVIGLCQVQESDEQHGCHGGSISVCIRIGVLTP